MFVEWSFMNIEQPSPNQTAIAAAFVTVVTVVEATAVVTVVTAITIVDTVVTVVFGASRLSQL